MTMATGGLFMFNDKFLTQVYGVAMGSPWGPTLANYFLADLENQLLRNYRGILPKCYLRYVDDIIICSF